MFLIDAIKPKVEKKLKLFYFVLGLLAAIKALFKRNENIYYTLNLKKVVIFIGIFDFYS